MSDHVKVLGEHVNTKLKCVLSQLWNLLFMKDKLLKVLSSFTKPSTCTMAILTTFMYSLSFVNQNGRNINLQQHPSNLVHIYCLPNHSFNIMTHGKFTKRFLHIKLSLNLIVPKPQHHFLSSLQQNVIMMRKRWERKDLTTYSQN